MMKTHLFRRLHLLFVFALLLVLYPVQSQRAIAQDATKVYAYLVDGTRTIQALDITEPKTPIKVNELASTPYTISSAVDVYIPPSSGSDVRAYFTGTICTISSVYVTNPSTPQYPGENCDYFDGHDIQVDNGYAYVASHFGLTLFNAGNLEYEGIFSVTGGEARSVNVDNGYAYVTSANTVSIFDLTTPDNPQLLGTYNATSAPLDVATVVHSIAYIALGSAGMQVVDISNPASPKLITTYTSDTINHVQMNGGFLYASTDKGLRVFDVASPSSPTLKGSYDGSVITKNLLVSDGYAYLSTNTGITIISLDNPLQLQEAGSYVTTHATLSVAVTRRPTSTPTSPWKKYEGNPVLSVGAEGSWDSKGVTGPSILFDGNSYKMWYTGYDTIPSTNSLQIGYATSSDGIHWEKYANNPVVRPNSGPGFDNFNVASPFVLYDNGIYKMWYRAASTDASSPIGYTTSIAYATSTDAINWTKKDDAPVLTPGTASEWDGGLVQKATVLIENGTYKMWYGASAYPPSNNNRIGFAMSNDGIHWTKYAQNPVLVNGDQGSWDEMSVDQPTVVRNNGIYEMWFDGDTPEYIHGIGHATSTDGVHWVKTIFNPEIKQGATDSWDDEAVISPSVIQQNGMYKMWYSGSHNNFSIGYAYQGEQQNTNTYAVSGRIIDIDMKPISGVTVSDAAGHQAVSDSNGVYTLSNLPAGNYTLTPSRDGYYFEPASQPVAVPPSVTEQNFVALKKDSSIVSGTVHDILGKAIPGVFVSLSSASHNQRNTVTDTSGSYSFRGVEAGSYTIAVSLNGYTFGTGQRVVSVPPDKSQDFTGYNRTPVLFVHGWNGAGIPGTNCENAFPKEGYFEHSKGMGKKLEDAGYYVDYVTLNSSNCLTPHIADNVPYLRNAIQLVKAKTGQNKVIIIAHSMGGIVSRAYIEDYSLYQNDVTALFTFGSPHLGAPAESLAWNYMPGGFVSLALYCNLYQPAVCDISETGMLVFNFTHQKRTDVEYHFVSGNAPLLSRNAAGIAAASLIDGDDDGLIPTRNGTNLPGDIDRFVTDEVHHSTFGEHWYFGQSSGRYSSYSDCIEKVLVIKTANDCGTISPMTRTASSDDGISEHSPLTRGVISPGQTVTQTIAVEGGQTLFATKWQTGTLNTILIDPDGLRIDSQYVAAHPNDILLLKDRTSSTYYLSNAKAGSWKLVLQSSNTAAPNPYTFFAGFKSDIHLTIDTSKTTYTQGATVVFTATLSGPVSTSAITATIEQSDGLTQTLTLTHTTANQFIGRYVAPVLGGYTEAQFSVNGLTQNNIAFMRGRSVLLYNASQTKKLFLPLVTR